MILRPLEPEDLDVLYEIENDDEMWQYGHTNVPFSRYLLSEYILTQKADIYADGQVRLIIEVDHDVVGIADLANFEPHDLRAEVSIIIKKEQWGRGYATQALQKLIAYSSERLMLEHLYAIVNETNIRSINLFRKAGFEQTANLKSWFKTTSNRENALVFQFFLKK